MPAILIVDDDPLRRESLATALRAAGWWVDGTDGSGNAVAVLLGNEHALVLLAFEQRNASMFAIARAIRARGDAARHVPILCCCAIAPAGIVPYLRAAGIDGLLAVPCTADALVAAVRPWIADDGTTARVELERLFGAADWQRLLTGLRDLLVEALDATTQGRAVEHAHRIAGLAGTLGFPHVSASWLALNEDPGADDADARAAARRAVHAIERRLGAQRS